MATIESARLVLKTFREQRWDQNKELVFRFKPGDKASEAKATHKVLAAVQKLLVTEFTSVALDAVVAIGVEHFLDVPCPPTFEEMRQIYASHDDGRLFHRAGLDVRNTDQFGVRLLAWAAATKDAKLLRQCERFGEVSFAPWAYLAFPCNHQTKEGPYMRPFRRPMKWAEEAFDSIVRRTAGDWSPLSQKTLRQLYGVSQTEMARMIREGELRTLKLSAQRYLVHPGDIDKGIKTKAALDAASDRHSHIKSK